MATGTNIKDAKATKVKGKVGSVNKDIAKWEKQIKKLQDLIKNAGKPKRSLKDSSLGKYVTKSAGVLKGKNK